MSEQAMSEQQGASGLSAEERAEGGWLVAAMTPPAWDVYDDNHSDDGWLIYGPDGDGLVTCHGNCALLACRQGGDEHADAAGIAWLVNHAAQLLADSANLARERQRVAALEARLNEMQHERAAMLAYGPVTEDDYLMCLSIAAGASGQPREEGEGR
jgi:hypothetical protein